MEIRKRPRLNIHFLIIIYFRVRKPNFELITVYAVQNPFLYGMFELRREQMKMQQESLEAKLRTGIKERQFFYPATFETLEAILR